MITKAEVFKGTVEEADATVEVCWGPREVVSSDGKTRSVVNDALTVHAKNPATGLVVALDASDKAIADASKLLLTAARAALATKVSP